MDLLRKQEKVDMQNTFKPSIQSEITLKQYSIWVALLVLISVSGCATHYKDATSFNPYGFFSGLWHGLILVFSVVGVLVSWVFSILDIDVLSNVTIIGKPNSGLLYYLGLIIGFFIGGGVSRS